MAITAAALLWSTIGTANAVRPVNADPLSVAAVRVAAGGGLLLSWALLRGHAQPVLLAALRRPSSATGWVVLGAVAVAAYQLSFFTAVSVAGVAVGTVVAMSSPPLVAGLVGAVTRARPITMVWMTSTGLAIAGCAVLVLTGPRTGLTVAGAAAALVAGVSFTAYSAAASALTRAGLPSSGVMGALFGGGGVLLLPLLLRYDLSWLLSPVGATVAAYLAVVATALAYTLYGWGLRTVPVTTSTVLSLADPGGAALLGLLVLGEAAGPSTVSGLALLGTALALAAWRVPPVRAVRRSHSYA